VIAAGRTDRGVHARGQVIAFDSVWKHPTTDLWRAVNANLPPDIALVDLQEAQADFHPRFDALSRRYVYQFYTAPVRNPLWDRYSWHIGSKIDLPTMQTAADYLIGEHDFATFGQPPKGTNTIRQVYEARCLGGENGFYQFAIEANAFLTHMVRSIMGILAEVGRGWISVAMFAEAFAAAERSRGGTIAPPHGLILDKVRYRGETALEDRQEEVHES
jgi:tRNA pseudouridine38-40 synthase